MLYKLINNRPVPFTGRYIEMNGKIYANPTEKQLTEAGYKPLITVDAPATDGSRYAVDSYTEMNEAIVQKWDIADTEDFDETEVV